MIAARGWHAWRNNVGAGTLDNGKFMRWGLANESRAVNEVVKSGDLIGFIPRVVQPFDVGLVIAQFFSCECKESGWHFNPRDPRDVAQKRWADLVNKSGGYAVITNSPDGL